MIDYGEKRIGLAISDERQVLALPLTTLEGGIQSLVSYLKTRQKEIEKIVVGLPLLMNGSKGEMALKVEKFAADLEKILQIPVLLFDERLSSKNADASLRELPSNRKQRAKKMDQVAAQLLLQSFLDQQK